MSLDFLLLQTLNGLSFGALLFFLASGLTVAFGLMRIVNLAHGAYYLLGGYLGLVAITASGNFWLGLLTGAATVALLGLGTERLLLRRIRGDELAEVLLTVGLAFVIADIAIAVFGGNPQSVPVPESLQGSVQAGPVGYPLYRLFVIGVAAVLALALWFVQRRTRTGAIIRAGVDDRETLEALGINVKQVFTAAFVVAAMLAGTGGVIGGAMLTLTPGMDLDVLLLSLVVVIIGGLGSLSGALVGSILVGLLDAFGRALVPELSYFILFAPMALVLVLRPQGLLGKVRN